MAGSERFETRLANLVASITTAATAYEARWTLAALYGVDPTIHGKLRRQIGLWQEASRDGGMDDIVLQGEALVRGYRRAVEVMVASRAEDDAYMLGHDEASGLVIAIGRSQACAARVAQTHPEAVYLDADEVAGLLHGLTGFKTIAAIKQAWPGATAQPQVPTHA